MIMEYKILERDAKLGDYNAREGADTTKEELFERKFQMKFWRSILFDDLTKSSDFMIKNHLYPFD